MSEIFFDQNNGIVLTNVKDFSSSIFVKPKFGETKETNSKKTFDLIIIQNFFVVSGIRL